jgi:predicted metal-dependent peptidase
MPQEDPFAALARAVARQGAQEKALQALTQARCRLILGRDARSAFFATLALRLTPQADWNLETMSTDGRRLSLNPEFVNGLSPDELQGVVAHEVLHTALTHHARRGQRDAERWNIACDLAVNPLLLEAGFTLPASRLVPGEGSHTGLPSGLSAEEYYALLSQESPGRPTEQGAGTDEPEEKGDSQDGQGQDQGQPSPDPGGCGGVRDPGRGSPAESRQSEA